MGIRIEVWASVRGGFADRAIAIRGSRSREDNLYEKRPKIEKKLSLNVNY